MIDQYLSTVNGTGDPDVVSAFHHYKQLYHDIKSCRKKAHRISVAITNNVNALVDFILDELRKCSPYS